MDVAPVAPANATPIALIMDSVATPNVEISEENVVPANDNEPQQAPDEPTVEPVRR